MSAANQNIQILLAVERESQQVVDGARHYRKSRLEEASQQAQLDIQQLVDAQTQQLHQLRQQLQEQSARQLQQLDTEMHRRCEGIAKAAESNMHDTVEWIVEQVILS